MRRAGLLVLGSVGGILAAVVLCTVAVRTLGNAPQGTPWAVEQTGLQVLEYISYTGAFLEDGSYRPVEAVAAVIIYNPTDALLERGAVKLQQGQRLLVFSFSWLPPGSRLLVQEGCGQAYVDEPVDACWGWCMEGASNKHLLAQEAGRTALAVTNCASVTLEGGKVYYKDYDPQRHLYLGGITYTLTVPRLRPGQQVVLPVYRYVSGSSMVIGG